MLDLLKFIRKFIECSHPNKQRVGEQWSPYWGDPYSDQHVSIYHCPDCGINLTVADYISQRRPVPRGSDQAFQALHEAVDYVRGLGFTLITNSQLLGRTFPGWSIELDSYPEGERTEQARRKLLEYIVKESSAAPWRSRVC